jgi:hypothetical protein
MVTSGRQSGGVDRRNPLRTTDRPYEALDAVVPDNQLEHRVVRAAVGKRAVLGRRQIVDGCPGQRHGRQHHPRGSQISDPPPQRSLRAGEVEQQEHRHDAECHQHLDVERNPDQGGAQKQIAPAPGLERMAARPRREQKCEHQRAIGIIRSVDRDTDRRQREEQRRQKTGCGAEDPPDEVIQHEDRCRAFEGLRQQDAERAEAEQLRAGRLDPEGDRRLVERDETARVESVEEEIVPARRHAAHAGHVIRGDEPAGAEAPATQQQRQCQNTRQGDARPQAGGVAGKPALHGSSSRRFTPLWRRSSPGSRQGSYPHPSRRS